MNKAVVVVGVLAAIALSGSKAKASEPTITEPPIDDPPDDPNDPEPVEPDEPGTGEIDPLPAIFTALLRPVPTPGMWLQITKSWGNLSKVAQYMALHHGGSAGAWAQAITRDRSNWGLYSTDVAKQAPAYWVKGQNGELVSGNITAAFLPVNDSWTVALAAGHLPRRLIQFTRQVNPNDGSTKVLSNGVAATGMKGYGALRMPTPECLDLGADATTSISCQPLPLLAAANVDPLSAWWNA